MKQIFFSALVALALAACGGGQIIDNSSPQPSSSIGVTELPSGAPLPSANARVVTITPESAKNAVAIAPGDGLSLVGWLSAERPYDLRVRLMIFALDGTSALAATLIPLPDEGGVPVYTLPADLDSTQLYLLAFDAPAGESFTDGSMAASVLLQLP